MNLSMEMKAFKTPFRIDGQHAGSTPASGLIQPVRPNLASGCQTQQLHCLHLKLYLERFNYHRLVYYNFCHLVGQIGRRMSISGYMNNAPPVPYINRPSSCEIHVSSSAFRNEIITVPLRYTEIDINRAGQDAFNITIIRTIHWPGPGYLSLCKKPKRRL